MLTKSTSLVSALRNHATPANKGENAPDASRTASSCLALLESKLNPLTKMAVNVKSSWQAGAALRDVQRQEIDANARIAGTAIQLSEMQVRKALIGGAMPAIGALTATLIVRTQQVDAALTNTTQAGAQAIVANRSATRLALDESFRAGHVSDQERDALIALADADHAGDLERHRARVDTCREVVNTLFRQSCEHLALGIEPPAA